MMFRAPAAFMPQSTPLGRGYGNIQNISTETLSWQSNLTSLEVIKLSECYVCHQLGTTGCEKSCFG